MSRSMVVGIAAVVIIVVALGAIAYFWTQRPKAPDGPPQGMMGKGGPMGGGPTPMTPPGAGGGPGGGPGGGQGGGPGGGAGGGMNFDPAQVWAPFGGTKEDSDKLTAYFETRRTATQAARDELEKLSDMAADEKASDADVAKALAAFRGTRDKAKAQLEADREALAKDLNLAKRPKLEAALTAFGILDNGIGGPRMGRGGFGGGRGGGGGGGGFGGGQGGGPGGGGGMGGPGGGTGGPGGGPGGGGAGGPGSGAQGL